MFRVLKWLVALAFTVAVAVAAVGVLAAYEELSASLPPLDGLLDYDPPVATRVYAEDGSLIEEFFHERRYRVPIEAIPPLVQQAFLAAEDADFFEHRGVDVVGIARAFLANVRAGSVVQGASTITQQVVKALLLSPERSYERKMKEILLSIRLEQELSKKQILELYLNQIYLGDGNHGVGAAARNYFGKPVAQLTAAEAAMLAGLPAAPSRYSPTRAPEAARARQQYVLRRMLEERFLTAGEYKNALREKVHVRTRYDRPYSERNYYTEAIRLQLEDMFGEDAPYNQGYSVYTAMQPRLQSMAEVALRNGIERIDWALRYRGPVAHLSEEEARERIEKDAREMGNAVPDPERLYQGVVTGVSKGSIDVAVGPWEATVDTSSVLWTWKVKTRRFQVGDVVEVRTRKTAGAAMPVWPAEPATPEPGETGAEETGPGDAGEDAADAKDRAGPEDPVPGDVEETDADDAEPGDAPPAEPPTFHIGQTPEIEAAIIVVDIDTGGIAAMVGGYDFLGSPFNRALQALRQPGSAFKPFIYSAALDHGYTPASIVVDEPVEYWDHDKFWAPRNYTRDYRGPMRLRTALEQSRNVISVKLVDAVGTRTVVDYLTRFHFDAKMGQNLSLALGTSEMTLRDITEGYTAFANGGVKVEPVVIRRVEDKDGNAFFTDEPRRREVLGAQTAGLMTYILQGVVQRGTATRVKALDRPAAGKTGTTNEQRDAWFLGFTPSMAVGVWVGFDDPSRTMGKIGTGGRVAAPIWLDFMQAALEGMPVRDFEIPGDISCVNIDPASGRRAGEWTERPFLECFRSGTEPAPGLPGAALWADWYGPQAPGPNAYGDGGLFYDGYQWPSSAGPGEPGPIAPGTAPPAPGGGRLRAEAVPTGSGTEIRLFRNGGPAGPSGPSGPAGPAGPSGPARWDTGPARPAFPLRPLSPPPPPAPPASAGVPAPSAPAPDPARQGEQRLWGTEPIEIAPAPKREDVFPTSREPASGETRRP